MLGLAVTSDTFQRPLMDLLIEVFLEWKLLALGLKDERAGTDMDLTSFTPTVIISSTSPRVIGNRKTAPVQRDLRCRVHSLPSNTVKTDS